MKSRAQSILYLSFEADIAKATAPTNHTMELARSFAKNDRRTIVITSGQEQEKSQKNFLHMAADIHDISGNKVQKVKAITRKNINFYRIAKRYVKDADVIYERHNTVGLVGLVLAWRYRKPLFYEMNSLNAEEALLIHGLHNPLLNRLLKFTTSFQLKRAEAVLVQTSELQKLAKTRYGLKRVMVVPNGSSPVSKKPKQLKKARSLKCIYVGTIDNYHSLDAILSTFSKIGNAASLEVVGDGPSLPGLKRKYTTNNITFTGQMAHEKALRRMEYADVGIAHYNLAAPLFKRFGFYFCPIKLFEYSGAALPTILIGSSNSIVQEFVDAGACIVLKNPATLKSVIFNMYNNFEEITGMSKAALSIAHTYTWDNAAKKTLEVLSA